MAMNSGRDVARVPGDGGAAPAVELRGVSKYYGNVRALDNVSLQIELGEFFCLLGPSGCGKTTTLNIVGGFIPLTRGEVLIDGKSVSNEPPYRRNCNTVFQNYALFPHMTVAENIAFGPRMKKVPEAEIKRRVSEMLELISLDWAADRWAKQLSGGQQQRVALARALVNRPAVLLLDEPLGALDLKLRKQLQGELSSIQRKVGITFIHVTHDQEEAMSMSDRIAVMSNGRVAQIGSPADIYYHPVNKFVAAFIGESNFFGGAVRDANGPSVEVDVPGLSRPIRCDSNVSVVRGQQVTVLVRPEQIKVGDSEPGPDHNAITGTLIKSVFLGMYSQLFVETGSAVTKIFSPNLDAASIDWAARIGRPIYVSWAPEHGELLVE